VSSMPPNQDVLKVGDVGPFEVLSRKANPDNLQLQYIPGIEALLARGELLKGTPLSEAEIARIRARADVMAVPAPFAKALRGERGYD
jgi:hypothetical protein